VAVEVKKPMGLEDIMAVLQEVAEQSKEVRQMFRDTAQRFQETDLQFKETDRKFQETDRQFKETDRKFQETDLQFKETDRKIEKVSVQIGQLGNRLGDFVQEMVRPAVVRLFQQRGIDVHEVHPNIVAQRDGESAEIDLMVVNDGVAIAVECKSNLSVDDVNEHLSRMDKIKRLLPAYKELELMGGVAAMVMSDDVARYAYRKGLYVLAQNGDAIVIRNDEKFVPVMW
jgi:hypothetical protein